MRLAWFSPFPPVRTGIAACSADLVNHLSTRHEIDCYVDEPLARQQRSIAGRALRSAHDFVWQHRRAPYDLTVYQLGNSSHHDYQWPYLFRYPGLVVLHDAHLHHARAAALLRVKRAADYRAEFEANHPEQPRDLAEMAVAGLDNHLYYSQPMNRLVVEASRLVAVHTRPLAQQLRQQFPNARIQAVRLGHGTVVDDAGRAAARERVRARYRIPADACLFGVFGGLTPEKRIPQILESFALLRTAVPEARLLLAGAPAAHYDLAAAIEAANLGDVAIVTGYIDSDDELTTTIAACDVALTMRWPTAREVSGPWLRALAARTPTVTTALTHTSDVPSLDPRSWRPSIPGTPPVTVAIDLLDEAHSLRLAIRRLAQDVQLRQSLAMAGYKYWETEHAIGAMVEDYERLLPAAAAAPAPRPELPPHLVQNGAGTLAAIAAKFNVGGRLWSNI